MYSFKLLIFPSLTALLLFSCKNDPKTPAPIQQDNLHGRWELSEGWRNGKQTETLTGTFYLFTPEGTLTTNLTTTTIEETFQFELSGNVIRQTGGSEEQTYTVESLDDSLLVMNMSIRNIPFKVKLQKGAEASTPPPVEATVPDSAQ